MRALLVAGTRPNFMKIAPLHRALASSGRTETIFVHTGQHHDANMSQVFLEELGLPAPDVDLGVGSGTHGEQTAGVLVGVERVIGETRPDVVVVVGDVNSTLGAALAASKLHVPVAHVEAGLRSFDRRMPEEINRIVTDAISDLLFAPSRDAVDNLAAEGIPSERVFLVGNVMIDSLLWVLPAAERSTILTRLGLEPHRYVLVTLHRPATVDQPETLADAVRVMTELAEMHPLVLVAHPRTRKRIGELGFADALNQARVQILDPLGYIDFVGLVSKARAVVTDSGGLQEETTVLGIPCITMRTTTERPVTISDGTNRLAGLDPEVVVRTTADALRQTATPGRPPLWDGHAAERIAGILLEEVDPRA
jgi:UDP-N-acetylglucosamine 2-epimerase (non-hydrolysing)